MKYVKNTSGRNHQADPDSIRSIRSFSQDNKDKFFDFGKKSHHETASPNQASVGKVRNQTSCMSSIMAWGDQDSHTKAKRNFKVKESNSSLHQPNPNRKSEYSINYCSNDKF